jgi:hypothetical protein
LKLSFIWQSMRVNRLLADYRLVMSLALPLFCVNHF